MGLHNKRFDFEVVYAQISPICMWSEVLDLDQTIKLANFASIINAMTHHQQLHTVWSEIKQTIWMLQTVTKLKLNIHT